MKKIKLLKEYLPLIILVPALLGGIWQIIELSSISIAYIRFFSVTQILPDGLVILILTITFAIAFWWFYNLERNINKDKISSYIFSIKKPKNYVENNIIFFVKKDNKPKLYTNVITLILMLCIDVIIYLNISKIINDMGNTLLNFILYFMSYIMMSVLGTVNNSVSIR